MGITALVALAVSVAMIHVDVVSAGTATMPPGAATATERAVRLNPPTTRVSLAPIVNRSTCRDDLGTPVMTIAIADISYDCPVYSGGQTMLDAGAVTLIDDPTLASVLARHPGDRGTLWIAGHRVSHGGAFAATPDLVDGATVTVTDAVTTASYRIVDRIYVAIENDQVKGANGTPSGAATADAILRTDRGANGLARLVLQTCDGDGHRWMIYADLISRTSA